MHADTTPLIIGALQGAPKEDLVSPRYAPPGWAWETDSLDVAIDAIASGSFKGQAAAGHPR